jgi:hypothetical protein
MKNLLSRLAILCSLFLYANGHAATGGNFQFFCQQDNTENETKTQHIFISRIYSVKSRYATHCYETNHQAQQDKFYNYLAREYDHLDLNHTPSKCFCFEKKSQANLFYRSNIQDLRNTPDIKLYLIRTFPN